MPTSLPIVLLINPNSNTETTRMMSDLATSGFNDHEVAVVGITAAAGPRMLIDPASLASSKIHVVEAVKNFLSGPHGARVVAIIVAAIGDPGRSELAHELDIPVVGIGEAAILAAAAQGREFGMATSTPLLVPSLTELVETHQKSGSFCGVQLTESDPQILAADPSAQFLELKEAVLRSVQSGAKAVIIAGGPLSETALRLSQEDIAAIIQPIHSACDLVRKRLNIRSVSSIS